MSDYVKINTPKVWGLYKFLIFFALLASFRPWFLWNTFGYVALLAIMVGVYMKLSYPNLYARQNGFLWVLLLFISVITGSLIYGADTIFRSVIVLIPYIFISLHKSEYKEDLLNTIQKYLAIIVIISLLGWIAYLIGVQTPYTLLSLGESDTRDSQYDFENHYIFLVNITWIGDMILPRFSSVFCEPGYLGCLMALNLCIGKYKKNKENIIFLLALLFSLSLAGYLLLFVGLFFFFLQHIRHHIGWSILILTFLVMGIIAARNVNGGNNIVNEAIFERLEYDSSRGTISGYNRSQDSNDQWFWNTFIHSDDLWLGQKKNFLDSNAVDWKSYIIIHGLISYIFWLLFLFYPALRGKNKWNCLVLSLIYLGISSQTLHMSQSLMYVAIFMLGVNRIRQKPNITIDYKENIKEK